MGVVGRGLLYLDMSQTALRQTFNQYPPYLGGDRGMGAGESICFPTFRQTKKIKMKQSIPPFRQKG